MKLITKCDGFGELEIQNWNFKFHGNRSQFATGSTKVMSNQIEIITSVIRTIRGKKVILDADLARIYGVSTKALNQAVKRNLQRFPDDFLLRLSSDELENLRSQIVTSSLHGGQRYLPYAFT
jgi:ORF6N domain